MTTLKCPAGCIFVLVQFEDPVLINFNYNKNFTLSFYFSFGTNIFNSLSEFSVNIFLCISCLQTIYFVF